MVPFFDKRIEKNFFLNKFFRKIFFFFYDTHYTSKASHRALLIFLIIVLPGETRFCFASQTVRFENTRFFVFGKQFFFGTLARTSPQLQYHTKVAVHSVNNI
jgi:hypothetical protein